ncbi:uncharacterized protein L201_000646 [Kwoniella dendrophila CBS 6074]|uniref:Sm domain-containing protein n=1 Tax=Kwoniella dendrophila CBS 6074 TaxID=1295534 RepID=A0AAX4JK85_9TREE
MAVPSPPLVLSSPANEQVSHTSNHLHQSSTHVPYGSPRDAPTVPSTSTSNDDHQQRSLENSSLTENKIVRPTLESILHQPLIITLLDGRTISGNLLCVDKEQNMILRDSIEYKPFYPKFKPISELSKEKEIEQYDEIRKNRQLYWPKSDFDPNIHPSIDLNGNPFDELHVDNEDKGRGWGGRSIGLICIKRKDISKIEIDKTIWNSLGGNNIN